MRRSELGEFSSRASKDPIGLMGMKSCENLKIQD